MSWKPILNPRESKACIESICKRLSVPSAEWFRVSKGEHSDPASRVYLDSGFPGISIMYSYAYLQSNTEEFKELAFQYLNQSIEAIGTLPLHPSLYEGFTGIAFAVDHVRRKTGMGGEDPVSSVDDVLLSLLRNRQAEAFYDLTSGLVGYGVYAAERFPAAVSQECLGLVVDRLYEMAEPSRDGVLTWFSPAYILQPERRVKFPSGNYNLGIAHGIPGVLGVLCSAVTLGIRQEQASEMLAKAAQGILKCKLKSGSNTLFPQEYAPDVSCSSSRLAWCYGDLGIASSIFLAGSVLHDDELISEGIKIGRHAARRRQQTGITDFTICHGTSGVAHIFNRLYQSTGEPDFREAALYWLEQTLRYRQEGGELEGFTHALSGWPLHPGILYGAAGAALVLMAASSAIEPEWDRILLLSVRGGV